MNEVAVPSPSGEVQGTLNGDVTVDSGQLRLIDSEPRSRIAGGILAVPGFRGATASCGLYDEERDDLALIVADRECEVAGVFTRNKVPAAPIVLTRDRIRRLPRARSLVINAGNANALTGPQGASDAESMGRRLEERCGGPTLVLSTGVIGVPLPIDAILVGIDAAADRLALGAGGPADRLTAGANAANRLAGSDDAESYRFVDADGAVARAILTTDTRTKTCAFRIVLPGDSRPVTIGGVAKGSGMIHPNMATMLAVIGVDRAVPAALLASMLKDAVDRSFHEISIDGDTSTNDAVLVLALPIEGDGPIEANSPGAKRLGEVITAVCRDLAGQIVADGEGMSRVLEVEVRGARSRSDAKRLASTIAGSLLVKTAVAGRDPNWGRFLAVAGNAGVALDPERIQLELGGVLVYANGAPRPLSADEIDRIFADDVVVARFDVGEGSHGARMATTDLTYEYVRINAEYTT